IIKENKKICKYKIFIYSNLDTLNNADIIHFHTTNDLYYVSKIYDLTKHIVLLTSHSPEPANVELYSALILKGISEKKSIKRKIFQEQIDKFAFETADYLIFPCEEAVSPYHKFINENNIDKKKMKYILTSSEPLIAKISKEDFRFKYNIPNNAKLICYVGRKNYIKGFDIFCQIAEYFKDDVNYYFISAGTGVLQYPLQNNFIDIGWTNDPSSVINSSDLQIIPNRNTYFDLGVIQALSLNTTIITTDTGGNKWFLDKKLNIHFADYNELNSFIDLIKNENIYSKDKRNQDFYEKYMNNQDFAKNYQDLYKNIFNSHKEK
ncbi:glycosyltransferase, partial [Arcobacter porcinus]